MCGITGADPGGQPPYATRIAMVRVPEAALADLEASNRYLEPADGPPSRDLAALGLPVPDPAGLDARLERVLRPSGDGSRGSDRASFSDYAELALACDLFWLRGAARASGQDARPVGGGAPGGPDRL